MNYVGIDLGGMNVAAAVVEETGGILGRASLPEAGLVGAALLPLFR